MTVFAAGITTGCRSIAGYAPAADAARDIYVAGSDLALGVSFSAPGQLVVGGRFATSPFVLDGTHSLTVLNETSGFVASIDVPSKTIRWAERVDANASRGSSVAGVAAYPGGVVAVGYASAYQPLWPTVRKRAVVTHLPAP